MTTTTELDRATIRRDAAAALRRLGWHQGNYIAKGPVRLRSRRPVCMVEAIGRAVGLPPATLGRTKCPNVRLLPKWDAAQDLMNEIAVGLGWDLGRGLTQRAHLTNWNDRKGRTLDEVLAALEGEASQ
ncbi:hypothetical protein ACFQYP_00720 [Nonomuraea antimicrobica]